jgi:ceramide glucosyltransferase
MYLQVALTTIALAALAVAYLTHLQQRRALGGRRLPPQLERYPSLTVIRPIKGLDHGLEDNVRAALDSGYPGRIETLFVFDDVTEPGVLPVQRAIAEHELRTGRRGQARIIYCGQPPAGRTGKLNAMIVALKDARNELVAFVDSDVRQDRLAMTRLVETLISDPQAGSAFAPVVVSERPRTAGDVGYALLLNGLYSPAAAVTVNKLGGEMPFIMGQFMVFRREAIAAIGGLESAEGQLVDDMYIGMRVKAAGYRNLVSPHPVSIVEASLSLRDFYKTYVRWITFSRSGLPGLEFKLASWLRGAAFFVGLAVAGVAAALGAWVAAATGAAAALVIAGSINVLHRETGGTPLSWAQSWISFALLLVSPAVYLNIFSSQTVSWRGRTYQLNGDSRLAEGKALAPSQALGGHSPQVDAAA